MPQVVAGVPASKEQAAMASSSSAATAAAAPNAAKQLAFTLPTSPDTKVYLHITNLEQSLMVHVATGSPATSSSTTNLGSFVLAMPNSKNPAEQPSSTPLYNRPESVDFMNRFAKVLAKKFNKPVYVGGDVKFWTPEDEGAAMTGALQAVQNACAST